MPSQGGVAGDEWKDSRERTATFHLNCLRVPSQHYIYNFQHAHNHRPSQSTDHSSGQAALGGGVNGWNNNRNGRGFDSPPAKQNSLQNHKEDFRTRPPLLDRRVGLVGELFDFCRMHFVSFRLFTLLSLQARPIDISFRFISLLASKYSVT